MNKENLPWGSLMKVAGFVGTYAASASAAVENDLRPAVITVIAVAGANALYEYLKERRSNKTNNR